MISQKVLISIVLCIIFLSGCANKTIEEPTVITKVEYIKDTPYTFQKVDLNGVYIDMGTKELQRQCSPKINEVGLIYKGVIEYYEYQMDEYKGLNDDNRPKE